ncbi:MAG: protease HtpX [Limnothrix sp. CACIAM 69d]|nr:MAG: protease HtpX [Limnothrix sp. CACIAM 69d]
MNQLKTTVLLASMSGLLIFASGLLFGGARGAFLGLVLAAVMNLGSWFYSDKIALAAYGAQPVNRSQAPHLYAMLERLCDRAGMPVPTLHIIPSPMANAFATGRDPNHAAVAVTEGILEILPEDELAAVIAHELSHIRNRDTLTQAVAATIAGAISYLAQAAMWFGGDRDRGNPFAGLLAMLLAPIAATVIQLGISRTREFSADAGAAELTGDPMALARALKRLETMADATRLEGNPAFSPLLIINPSAKDWLRNLFSTHPSTESRIAALARLAGR